MKEARSFYDWKAGQMKSRVKIPYDSPVLTLIAMGGFLFSSPLAVMHLAFANPREWGPFATAAMLAFFFPFLVLPAAWAFNTLIAPRVSDYMAADEETRQQLEIEKEPRSTLVSCEVCGDSRYGERGTRMIRETRSFYNPKTSRQEVWLEQFPSASGGYFWTVSEYGDVVPSSFHFDTDEGYVAARADYEVRVALRTGKQSQAPDFPEVQVPTIRLVEVVVQFPCGHFPVATYDCRATAAHALEKGFYSWNAHCPVCGWTQPEEETP